MRLVVLAVRLPDFTVLVLFELGAGKVKNTEISFANTASYFHNNHIKKGCLTKVNTEASGPRNWRSSLCMCGWYSVRMGVKGGGWFRGALFFFCPPRRPPPPAPTPLSAVSRTHTPVCLYALGVFELCVGMMTSPLSPLPAPRNEHDCSFLCQPAFNRRGRLRGGGCEEGWPLLVSFFKTHHFFLVQLTKFKNSQQPTALFSSETLPSFF